MKRIAFALSIIPFGFMLSALSSNASADAGMYLVQPANSGSSSIVLNAPVRPGTQLILVGPSTLTTDVVTAGVGPNTQETLVTPPLKSAHPAGTVILAR